MKVSILIPTYNRAGYLRQALESARRQTYPDLEIVVGDNASIDGTPRVREEVLSDPRIRWHRNEVSVAMAPSWEKLLYELATGDYVKLLADDDYIQDPEHIAKAVRVIEGHGADAVFSGCGAWIESEGRLEDITLDLPERLTPSWWLENFSRKQGGRAVFPNLTTAGVFHRAKAMALGAYRNPVFGMDYELGCKFMLGGPTGYVPGVQCVERHHPNNDGRLARLDVVLSGLELFARVRRYGDAQGLPAEGLEGYCSRGLDVFVQSFLIRSWARERGMGPFSVAGLYRTLAQADGRVAARTVLRPSTYAKMLEGRAPAAHSYVRQLYRRFKS